LGGYSIPSAVAVECLDCERIFDVQDRACPTCGSEESFVAPPPPRKPEHIGRLSVAVFAGRFYRPGFTAMRLPKKEAAEC
jgi:hypothetical protein